MANSLKAVFEVQRSPAVVITQSSCIILNIWTLGVLCTSKRAFTGRYTGVRSILSSLSYPALGIMYVAIALHVPPLLRKCCDSCLDILFIV